MAGISEILFGRSGGIDSDSRAAGQEVGVVLHAVTGQGDRPNFKGTINGDLLDRINEGMLLVADEQYNAAIPYFQEAVDFLNVKPGLQYHDLLLEAIVNLGNALVRAEELADAESVFKTIVDTDPNNGERAILYARVLEFLARSDDVIAENEEELWQEAAKYLTTARRVGIPEERKRDFYSHSGVVFSELLAIDGEEGRNSKYLDDVLTVSEEGFDYFMSKRLEKGFHTWEDLTYNLIVCGKANRDHALRGRRKDSDYVKLTDAVAHGFEPSGNITTDAYRSAAEASGANRPSTEIVDEDIYAPGSMAETVSEYKESNVLDKEVVAAIELTRRGKLRNMISAITKLRELRDQEKDLSKSIQAAGALSGIYLGMANHYAKLQGNQQNPGIGP